MQIRHADLLRCFHHILRAQGALIASRAKGECSAPRVVVYKPASRRPLTEHRRKEIAYLNKKLYGFTFNKKKEDIINKLRPTLTKPMLSQTLISRVIIGTRVSSSSPESVQARAPHSILLPTECTPVIHLPTTCWILLQPLRLHQHMRRVHMTMAIFGIIGVQFFLKNNWTPSNDEIALVICTRLYLLLTVKCTYVKHLLSTC